MMDSWNANAAELTPAGREKQVISGECQTAKLPFLQAENLRFGVWQCTIGSWVSTWESWEYFTVISGIGTLTDDAGKTHVLEPGVSVMIPAGSRGTWALAETLRKSYVVPVLRTE